MRKQLLVVNCFRKKLHFGCLTGFAIRIDPRWHSTETFLSL